MESLYFVNGTCEFECECEFECVMVYVCTFCLLFMLSQ